MTEQVESKPQRTIQVVVQAGTSREFPVSVFPGCIIEYSFDTEGGDIAFSVMFEDSKGAMEAIIHKSTVDSDQVTITGTVDCTRTGTLWFQWDNSYSWFTNKTLKYSVGRTGTDGASAEGETKGTEQKRGKDSDKDSVSSANTGEEVPTDVIEKKSKEIKVQETIVSTSKPLKLVLGTMTFSDQVQSEKMASSMVKQFTDHPASKAFLMSKGLNLENLYAELDTARMYNKGKTEEFLSRIKSSFPSGINIRFATKANPFKGYNDNLRPDNVKYQLNASLKALNEANVDIFYLHAPDHQTPILETLKAVDELFRQGKFSRLGLSNYSAWEVCEIYYLCDKHGFIKPSVYQGMYNLLTRQVEQELFPCLRQLNISFYAYNLLAGGLLTGKYKDIGASKGDGRFGRKGMGVKYSERYWKQSHFDAINKVAVAAEKQGLKLIDVAITWLAKHSAMDAKYGDAVIIGASKASHLQQALDVFDKCNGNGKGGLELSDEVLETCEEAWKTCQPYCPTYNR